MREKEKKQSGGQKSPGITPSSTAEISITDFLEIVKDTHQSILSQDVLNHFNEKRNPNGYYSGRAKFSFAPTLSKTAPAGTQITPDFTGAVAVEAEPKTRIRNIVDTIQKKTGIKIGFAEYYQDGQKNTAYKGHYDPTTKTLYFRKGASNAEIIYKTAMHELTHAIENSRHYSYVRDYVLNKVYGGEGSERYKTAIQEKIDFYDKNGQELTPEQARAELVAEKLREAVFASGEDVRRIVEQDYTFAQHVHDWIDSMLYWVKNTFVHMDEKAQLQADLEQAQRKYRLALVSAKGMRGGGNDFRFGKSVDGRRTSGYNDGSQYRTMWTIEDGILSGEEVAAFYEKISELNSRNYRNYRVSSEGDYIFEVGNKIIYTDGAYDYPTITKVVSVDSQDEGELVYAREMIYDGEEYGIEFDATKEIIEIITGEGTVLFSEIGDSRAYEREKRRGERAHSGKTVRGSGEDVNFSFSSPKSDAAQMYIDAATDVHFPKETTEQEFTPVQKTKGQKVADELGLTKAPKDSELAIANPDVANLVNMKGRKRAEDIELQYENQLSEVKGMYVVLRTSDFLYSERTPNGFTEKVHIF